jgi:hypothetical protein
MGFPQVFTTDLGDIASLKFAHERFFMVVEAKKIEFILEGGNGFLSEIRQEISEPINSLKHKSFKILYSNNFAHESGSNSGKFDNQASTMVSPALAIFIVAEEGIFLAVLVETSVFRGLVESTIDRRSEKVLLFASKWLFRFVVFHRLVS